MNLLKLTLLLTSVSVAFGVTTTQLMDPKAAPAKKAEGGPTQPTVAPAVTSTTASPSVSSGPVFDISKGFSSVAEKAIPAVVNISTTQVIESKGESDFFPKLPPGSPFEDLFKDFFDHNPSKPRRIQSLGSGFFTKITDDNALIVTNFHVIQNAKKITAILHDGTELEATVQATDERTDLALLKVSISSLKVSKKVIQTLNWGDSNSAKVGDWVLAIGNPFGLGSTVTAGIISNRSRDIRARSGSKVSEYVDDFIQHSAPINMGNSGGVLLNLGGEVVGINTAIFSPSGGNVGIGFAIPSLLAKNTIEQLISHGKAVRGWLGLRVHPLSEEDAEALGLPAGRGKGALVGEVIPGGPSDKKIFRNDVILEFDGKEVNDQSRLTRIVGETEVGKLVKIKTWRAGKEIIVEIKLGEFQNQEPTKDTKNPQAAQKPTQSIKTLGMTLSALTPEARRQFGLTEDAKGLVVMDVDVTSNAAEKGIEAGDLILEGNQKEVKVPQDILNVVEDAKKLSRHHVLFLVSKKGQPRFVSLKLEESKPATPASAQGQKPATPAQAVTPAQPAQPAVPAVPAK